MISFNINNLVVLFIVILISYIFMLIGYQSTGPDINNYKLFEAGTLHSHESIQFFIYIVSLLKSLVAIEHLVIFVYIALAIKLSLRSHNPLAAVSFFTVYILFSYEWSTLYGNVLRNGFAVFFIALALPSEFNFSGFKIVKSLFLLSLSYLHLITPLVVIWLYYIKSISNRNFFRTHYSKFSILFILFIIISLFFLDYIIGRVSLLFSRSIAEDFLGYIFSYFLFSISLLALFYSRLLSFRFFHVFIFFLVFLLLLPLGEYAQRVVISLSFINWFLVFYYSTRFKNIALLLIVNVFFSILSYVYIGDYFIGYTL